MMAVANDEWNGELTQFLDKLPARPCLVPPAPSFCGVCGSINAPVARSCKFYALRHERERGQTFIELESKRRAGTFEIEIEFEEEDEEEELPGAPMFEYSRPSAGAAIKGRMKPAAAPRVEKPVEPEIYEAEVVEVIEEPPVAPAAKPQAAKEIENAAKAEEQARRLEAEILEKQVRAEREKELRETEELEMKVRAERERELAEQAEIEKKALGEPRAREKARPTPPAKVPEDQVLSKEEEDKLEREIEEELSKAGLAPAEKAPARKEPETPTESRIPPDQVIAPIYSQPILKIIPSKGEVPKAQPLPPLPPPPPPPPPMEEPRAALLTPEQPAKAPEPEKVAPPPAAPAPKEAPPAPGQRRTGGLYGIFRKAPKEQPKLDGDKNEVEDELAKRLKKEAK